MVPPQPWPNPEQQPDGTICFMMFEQPHLSYDDLEAYSLGRVADAGLERNEEHLLYCETCQNEFAFTDQYVIAMKHAVRAQGSRANRLRSVHITDDGPIFGSILKIRGGKWFARHWGRQLDGGRQCDSVEEVNAFLMDSFSQMFPRARLLGSVPGGIAVTSLRGSP